jgi:ABC-type multidrug transport system fused ATPase/permease subunit
MRCLISPEHVLGYGCLVLLLLQVVFSYNPLIGQPVLKGVSFTAPGGKTLAIT